MSTAIRGFYKRYATSGDHTWHIDKRIKSVGRLCARRKFHEAAAKYLVDFAHKSTIRRDAAALKDLSPYISDLWLDRINNDSFNAYRKARHDLAIITRNAKIAVTRRVLKLAAEVWCHPGTNMTWLERAPAIVAERGHCAREPYPLDASEQELLFNDSHPTVAGSHSSLSTRG